MIYLNERPVSSVNRNLFKNPNFVVIQGTASAALTNSLALPTASLGYPGETEWIVAASGGTPTYAFAAESLTLTGAASTTAIHVAQRIESRDMVTYANRLANMTLSAEMSNSLLTSVTWEVFRPTTTNDTHGTIAVPTQTLIASGTFTVDNTLRRYSISFALPALATRGLEVRFRVGAQISGTWTIARLQLEEGSTATSFSCDNFQSELMRCRRHYQAIGEQFTGVTSGTTIIEMNVAFWADTFSIPVVATIAGTELSCRYLGGDLAVPVASLGVSNVSVTTQGLWFQGTTTGLTSGVTVTSRRNSLIANYLSLSAHIP